MLLRLAALLVLASTAAAAADLSCRDKPLPPAVEGQASAVDGDTLVVAGSPRLRLWGIQAPELRDKASGRETRPGMAARAALADLLLAGPVECRPSKWDRYCRLVATCTAAGRDLSASLLERGMAYGFMLDDPLPGAPDRGAQRAVAYSRHEATARTARAGLWREWLGD